ncbi:MAG: Addiction module antitoxin RelB [Schlesneria sp.]|nr:Addiction module antitoxin RelB [Schlesneria sp.]
MSLPASYEEVLRTAQSLPETERVRLVQELLNSLNSPAAESLDDLWLAEIDLRSDEIDSGMVQTIPWAEVRRRARERAKLNG